MTKRKVICSSCSEEQAEIITDLVFYEVEDSSGATHVVPLGYKKMLETKVKEAGLTLVSEWKQVPEDEPIKQGLCDTCEQRFAEQADIVLQGGMFYKCEECGQQGVFTKCQFSDEFREQMGEEYTKPNQEGMYPAVFGSFGSCSEHKVTVDKESISTPQENNTKYV